MDNYRLIGSAYVALARRIREAAIALDAYGTRDKSQQQATVLELERRVSRELRDALTGRDVVAKLQKLRKAITGLGAVKGVAAVRSGYADLERLVVKGAEAGLCTSSVAEAAGQRAFEKCDALKSLLDDVEVDERSSAKAMVMRGKAKLQAIEMVAVLAEALGRDEVLRRLDEVQDTKREFVGRYWNEINRCIEKMRTALAVA